jgi:capping protein beta
MADPQLLAALDLMRRLPPSRMEKSLEELVDLVPDLTDDLLNTVDQPLQVAKGSDGRPYLLCDYNRDGDSYRSPWTNEYDPPLDDGVLPSDKLRQMETIANDVFDGYREMYYEGGASSVYFWELDETSFAACVLFKKDVEQKVKDLKAGNWDAIHVIEIRPQGKGKAAYKLTSTIMLRIVTDHAGKGSTAPPEGSKNELNLSGSLTRQQEQELDAKDQASHVANMGRMVEEMENRMRDSLQTIYFGKTKSVLNGLYKAGGAADQKKMAVQSQLAAELMKRG